jgi:hypothetical protein
MTLPRRKLLAVTLLGCAAIACAGPPDAATSPGTPRVAPNGTAVPVTRLRREPYSFTYYSGLREPARLVIRDEATWRSTWSAIWQGLSPTPELPAVDFSREMLVVAALGSRPSGGFGILIESATSTSDGLVVQVRTIAPGGRCMTTQAFSQPVDVARLPLTDGPVSFANEAVTTSCD